MTDHENGTEAQSSKEAAVIPLFPWLADRMKRYFHERKAAKQKETTEERSSRVTANATVVVAIFAIVATLIAGSQAVIGNRTLDETRAEQRPVIWTGSDLGAPRLLVNPQTGAGQIYWTIHYTNWGKGFVKDGRSKSYIRIGSGNFEQSFGQKDIGNGIAPMAPNQDFFNTAISRPGIKPTDFAQWETKEDQFFVKFVFIYFDLAGNRYETSFCLNKLVVGSIGYCTEGNYVK